MATVVKSPILDQHGRNIVRVKQDASTDRRNVRATFDAARYSPEMANHWANADALDADSSHSKEVRHRLIRRSRYEVANNGYTDGIVQTYATDLIGYGPTLKIKKSNYKTACEQAWRTWSKKIQLRRKLWTMAHAKVQDGEAFGMAGNNPRVKHPIQLDIKLIEAEQCQTPNLAWAMQGYIDGIKFDDWGNPEHYDIMHYHPGGTWFPMKGNEYNKVPAKFVFHWFLQRRPGQHRAVPEFRSTLNTGANSRRWREATIAAAEVAADISVLLKTTLDPNQVDEVDPMSTIPFQKRMMTALPNGYDALQMKSEHPNATYESFNQSLISEQSRPKSMPYNKAACDSSKYNYASGRLDHQTYYGFLNFEREDANDLVLDPLFELFWEEAVLVYGWDEDPYSPPETEWLWPEHPIADVVTEAQANDIGLKNMSLSLSDLYAKRGDYFDDKISQLARDYGVTVDQAKELIRRALFNAQNQQASLATAQAQGANVSNV